MTLNSTKFRSDLEETAFVHSDRKFEYGPNSGMHCLTGVNVVFVFLTVTMSVMSALAVFLNALLIRLLYRSKILHPNVRLLLKNLALAVFLGSLFMFLKFTIYHPFLILVGFQRMSIKNTVCSLIELPFHVCSLVLILSITGIGIERLSATIREKCDSEETGKGTKATLIIIWLVAFGNIFAGYIYSFFNPHNMCYCHLSLIVTQKTFAVNTVLYVFVEVSVLFVFWYVYYRNCKDYCNFTINTARHNLHARFQLINNVETTRTLLPVVVVHAFFWTAYLLSLTFVRNFLSIRYQPMLKINAMIAVYHLLPLEMLIQPILIVRRSDHLKKVALEMFPKLVALWGTRQTSGLRYPHHQNRTVQTQTTVGATYAPGVSQSCGQETTCAAATNSGPVSGNVSTSCGGAALSLKRKTQQSVTEISTVVDYRMRPETHQDILEHIWSAKPILSSCASDGSSVTSNAGVKKNSFKRNSFINRAKTGWKQERSSGFVTHADDEDNEEKFLAR